MTPNTLHSETVAETILLARRPRQAKPASTRRILRTLTAAVTALGLMAASLTSAHAERRDDDLAKAIAAIAAIALIGSAVQNDRNRDRRGDADPAFDPRPSHDPRPSYDPQPTYHPQWRNDDYRPHDRRAPRVPGVCAIEVDGNRGTRTVYSERCLRDEGFRYPLPRYCARQIRSHGHTDRVYSARCLQEAGFRINGRGRY